MTSHEHTASFRSSQDFVRALKTPSDPPVAGGPSKIEIVQHAWADASFYMPSKAEVIVEWIFTKLLKEKGKELALNPIFDSRYWELAATLSSSQAHLASHDDARGAKSWLTALLHRTPLAPVVIAFLTSFKDVPGDHQDALAAAVNSCLSVIWHTAVQKITTEQLQECFGGILGATVAGARSNGVVNIARMVSASYRNSLTNSSNKKKLHQSFLQSQLRNWLAVLSVSAESLDQNFKSTILETGIETLFNLDVLRQTNESRTENPLIERLQAISQKERALVLQHIPDLFAAYVQAIKRNRGALFSQGSQAHATSSMEELHANGMLFFISLLGLLGESTSDKAAWTARLLLLKTVHKENLFDDKQSDSHVALSRVLELILLALGEGWKEQMVECAGLAVQCLSIVANIDHDLVLPCVPRILPLLLQIPVASESYFEFLEILLSYHTKTLTVSDLVKNLLASVWESRTCPGDSLKVYQICFSSPLMNTTYLQHLVKAVQVFLTESQTLPTIQLVFDSLKDTWEKVYSRAQQKDDGGGSKKRRRTSSAFVESSVDLDDLAINYALIARLSSVVLSSLPMSSLPGPTREEVKTLVSEFRSHFIHHALSKCVKMVKKRDEVDLWSIEIVSAASLRLLYALDVSRNLALPPKYDAKLFGKALDIVEDDTLLPEHTLELFRFLLYNTSQTDEASPEVTINRLIEYIERHFAPSGVVWSGDANHLTRSEVGRAEAALAIMHMVVERWLPEIDRLATPEQLQRLLKTIISIKLPVGQPKKVMQPERLLLDILHSAQFFEFLRIHAVFLELISSMTARLDPSAAKPPKTSSMLEKVAIYQHLLLFPMEYFTWPVLNDLINRALSADVALSRASSKKEGITEALIVLRIFVQRAYVYCASIGQDWNKDTAEFLTALLNESPVVDQELKEDYIKASLDLVEVYFSQLLKLSKKHGTEPVVQVLQTFAGRASSSQEMASNSFIRLVDLLVKDFPKSSLPEEVVTAVRKLYNGMSSTLLSVSRVVSVAEMELTQANIQTYCTCVSGWYSMLCLHNWLEIAGESSVPLLGQKLVSRLMLSASGGVLSGSETDEAGVMTFAVVLKELDLQPASEHGAHLDLVVAVYIALSGTLSATSLSRMDALLAKECRKLPLEDYTHLLALVSGSLADVVHMHPDRLLYMVHLAALLLQEHPSHSLVHIQKFASSCINTFTEHSVFVDGPVLLRVQVLDMIMRYCTDQQMALRSQDTAGVFLLLSKRLAPSQVHDPVTESGIFHKIIGILSALVRQRRDLVTHALPHLGLLLRELLLCMRACRPNLGARQTAIVMNTQPRWLSASQALGVVEARALARVLESLTAKTVVRVLAGQAQAEGRAPPKAESLSKPFAKHAVYVLKAYVEAMCAPLVVLSLEVRRELLPGLFALCGMVSEHSRDALMVSALDGDGRTALKALWKEYDKQRYVGRG